MELGGACGYKYKLGEKGTLDYGTGPNTVDTGHNLMYYGGNAIWMFASPCAYTSKSLCLVYDYYQNRQGLYRSEYGTSCAVCPFVSLKSTFKVQVEE